MFQEMFRQWWRLMFWWLPHNDAGTDSVVSDRVRPEPGSQPSPEDSSVPKPPPAAEATSAQDDLTSIKGIGEAMEKKLNAAGVSSFSELAAADADDLTATLKKSQPVLSAAKVQGWIDEARQRSAH
ncbi:DUF4332 domain-containing protein [Ectothiorhodospiraceae bacterium WFHF3C12]|nr:DUF4332 domain-containing protein [Ectothiorhodospiraceae bacterium WFHF3C12]